MRGNEAEHKARVDLAAAFRLIAHFGWDDMVFTHLSIVIPGTEGRYLVNPWDRTFDEMTASDLLEVDVGGRVISGEGGRVNPSNFIIHGAIHAARPDACCVLHTHAPAAVAVSALEQGLLPITQTAAYWPADQLAYHDYEGVAEEADEAPRLVADLGDARALLLRNHGLLTTGATVAEAFLALYLVVKACEAQVQALGMGLPI